MKSASSMLLVVLLFFGLCIPHAIASESGGHGHTGSIGESSIEREIDPERPTVLFYKLPRCGICTQIDHWLIKLDEQHPNVANYVRKNSTDTSIHLEMNERGIQHHGVVFLDLETNAMWAAQAHGLHQQTLTDAFNQHIVLRETDSGDSIDAAGSR